MKRKNTTVTSSIPYKYCQFNMLQIHSNRRIESLIIREHIVYYQLCNNGSNVQHFRNRKEIQYKLYHRPRWRQNVLQFLFIITSSADPFLVLFPFHMQSVLIFKMSFVNGYFRSIKDVLIFCPYGGKVLSHSLLMWLTVWNTHRMGVLHIWRISETACSLKIFAEWPWSGKVRYLWSISESVGRITPTIDFSVLRKVVH